MLRKIRRKVSDDRPKIGIVGHVDYAVISRVPAVPALGEIARASEHAWIPGGGGGIAYFQMVSAPADVHFFTALGNDHAAEALLRRIGSTKGVLHAAPRSRPQTCDIVMITPDSERTILVLGAPLQPNLEDELPWDVLGECRAVYFTGEDPRLLEKARAAELLVVAARRGEALAKSGVRADVVIGSAADRSEAARIGDYSSPPRAVVMTRGASGGTIETTAVIKTFSIPATKTEQRSAYGAGDSFAGALTWYLSKGLRLEDACMRAAAHGAAVLSGGIDPLANQLPLI